MKLTTKQQAELLHKTRVDNRRGQKKFLKDLGGEGTAEELDALLDIARGNTRAVAAAERLDRQRAITARTIELGLDGHVAEMLANVQIRMEDEGITQMDVAEACGWSQALVSRYLSGAKEPGARNLAKLAAAVGCVWRLTPAPSAHLKNATS